MPQCALWTAVKDTRLEQLFSGDVDFR